MHELVDFATGWVTSQLDYSFLFMMKFTLEYFATGRKSTGGVGGADLGHFTTSRLAELSAANAVGGTLQLVGLLCNCGVCGGGGATHISTLQLIIQN